MAAPRIGTQHPSFCWFPAKQKPGCSILSVAADRYGLGEHGTGGLRLVDRPRRTGHSLLAIYRAWPIPPLTSYPNRNRRKVLGQDRTTAFQRPGSDESHRFGPRCSFLRLRDFRDEW